MRWEFLLVEAVEAAFNRDAKEELFCRVLRFATDRQMLARRRECWNDSQRGAKVSDTLS
jgi:hypothetical protein